MPIEPSRARRLRVRFAIVLLALALPGRVPASQAANPSDGLRVGAPVERELAGGGADTHTLYVASGQYLNVVVEQRGIDVAVAVVSPSGKQIMEVDSPNGTQGPEPVAMIAEETGVYRIGVRSLEKGAAAGRYEIRVVELRASTPDEKPLMEAVGLFNQSVQLGNQGHFKEAVAPVERAVAIREKVLGPDHLLVADAVEHLGYLHLWLGAIAAAEPLYLRALAIREKTLGPEHPDTAQSLYRLAALYLNKGQYEKAEQFYRRALAIREKVFGLEHTETANIVSELGVLYQLQNDVARAEPLYRRALAIREKTVGPNDPLMAIALMNVAWIAMYRGENSKAEPLYARALAIREKALGPDHPDVAETLRWMSALFERKGDYDKALAILEQAIAILQKSLGPDHPNVATAVGDLAHLYVEKKDYTKAEVNYQRALAASEKSLGPNHPFVGSCLVYLGYFYNEIGQYAKAEPLFQRGLSIFEKALGPESIRASEPLSNLAYMYTCTGEPDKAEPLYKRALAIREKAFGQYHPEVADSLANLAAFYMRTGKIALAVDLRGRANEVVERTMDMNLATGSERQKLLYLTKLGVDTNVTVSLHARLAPDDPAARRMALLTVLRRKGRALDAMVDSIGALRRRLDPGDQALLDRLTDARSRLATLVLKGASKADPARHQAEVKEVEEQLDRLEAEISARSAAFRAQTLPVTIEAVQAAIPADSALVEFVRYKALKPGIHVRADEWDPPRYAAYVLGNRGEPAWTDLGDAETIDKASDALRDALRDRRRTDAKALARAVDDKVMRPVRALLGPTRRVLLSPDGELNLIPFAALVDEENAYLVERYSFTYLTTGRDLLRLQVRRESTTRGPIIFADPTFGPRASAGSERMLVVEESAAGTPRLYFSPLPGTAQEARALRAILPGATVMTKDAATETALKEVRAPSILHVATHGFFLHEPDAGAGGPAASGRQAGSGSVRVDNPLLRAGLGLAGANLQGSGDDDGVLTALEAASMDLWGTKLVVLSACDTGVGEVRNGEGVYGLRRALVIAGSESQVISLWPVSDTATRDLMAGYYRGLQAGEGRGEALRQVQLRMLRSANRRQPYYWASFIESGAWTSLDDK